jgi:serine/threonine protein kinase
MVPCILEDYLLRAKRYAVSINMLPYFGLGKWYQSYSMKNIFLSSSLFLLPLFYQIALKKISKRLTNKSAFKNETDALLRIWDNGGHPNISGLRDMYEDHSYYYLILDLVSGGEMFQHLIEYGAYSEADAARLMREVASALAFMHGIGIFHADLKPENLLLCSKMVSNGTIKIIDFGCASVVNSAHKQEDELVGSSDDTSIYFNLTPRDEHEEQSVGTTAYWPPERFLPGAKATSAMDMWSTGVILYIMLTGVHPFDPEGNSSDSEIEKRLLTDPSPPIGTLTAHLSPSVIDLMKKLMHPDPEKRLDAYSTMRHPWICGETARTEKMEGSNLKLSKFKEMREGIESAIFAALVESSDSGDKINEALVMPRGDTKKSDMHIMKKAFAIFDQAGKGYVTSDDLGRVVSKVTGKPVSPADSKEMLAAASDSGFDEEIAPGLSLAVFSELFGNLKHVHFHKGDMIFNAGDDADSMYFITCKKDAKLIII